jgi:hypothetical protein
VSMPHVSQHTCRTCGSGVAPSQGVCRRPNRLRRSLSTAGAAGVKGGVFQGRPHAVCCQTWAVDSRHYCGDPAHHLSLFKWSADVYQCIQC